MTPDLKKAIEEAVAKAIKPLGERIDRQAKELKKAYRQRSLAMTTATLCLVAAAFSVGYAAKSQEALSNQTEVNKIVVCANAKSTALAFRSPQITETQQGERRRETKDHFLERMVAQRETLIAVGNLDCPDIKGFDSFEYLRGKALLEIDRILIRDAPKQAEELGAGKEEGVIIPHKKRCRTCTDSTDSGKSAQGPVATTAPTTNPTVTNTEPTGGTHTGSTVTHHPSTNSHHGGGTHVGTHKTPHEHPAPTPESPEQKQEPEPTLAPETSTGTGATGGEANPGDTTTTPTEPAKAKLLPGVVEPVEELVCKTVLSKLVCPE